MNISNFFNIEKGHEHLDFVDVNISRDNRLFIDPTLIAHDPSPVGRECQALIMSYFHEVFDCIRTRNLDRLWNLSMFAREPNETSLGLSRGRPSGKGASPEILMRIYQGIMDQGLLENGIIQAPADITLYTENFGADRMSDLITNIIRRVLYEFTVMQCNRYRYALSAEPIFLGALWSPEAGIWADGFGPAMIVNGEKRLLVPKQFVCKRSIKSASEMFMQIIVPYLQEEHLAMNSSLVRRGVDRQGNEWTREPSKKDVCKDELKYGSTKERIRSYLDRNFVAAQEYDEFTRKNLEKDGCILTDQELDDFIYTPKFKLKRDA